MTAVKSIQPLQFPLKTQDPFLFCTFHNDKYQKEMEIGSAKSLTGRSIGQDFSRKDG